MKPKTSTIILDKDGSYLGMEKGCFVVRDRHNNVERYPLFENEVKEVVLKTGSFVSTGALTSLGFWGVDVLVLTRRNKPVAILRSLNNDSHVETRVCQYEALKNGEKTWLEPPSHFLNLFLYLFALFILAYGCSVFITMLAETVFFAMIILSTSPTLN